MKTTSILTPDLIDSIAQSARNFSGSMSHGDAVHMAVNEAIGFDLIGKNDKYPAIDLVSQRLLDWEISGK